MKIAELQKKYKLDKDSFWEVRKGTWVISHNACEKIATVEGIHFNLPTVYQGLDSICLIGSAWIKQGNKEVWTTGEASEQNVKGQGKYYWAMAEKRLKDRLILKLINAAEYGLYSETEAESFKNPKAPQSANNSEIRPMGKDLTDNDRKFLNDM